ncbi:GNAT family N-acetyltransferase [Inhella sp.]|uniref:GNAT family N-acetyltransferase n=1 Tax=Inhella sp. TaxID=1921806 RepID=UPI0035B1035C
MSEKAAPAVRIRRIAVSDAAAIAAAFADPEMYSGTLQLPYPGEAGWRARIEGMLAPGSSDHVLVAEREGQFVGMAGLHSAGASARRRHAMHLGITIAATAQGQGVGKLLMAALTDLADNWLGVLRLELTVYSDNARAIALYERFGFVREGLLRGYGLRNGQYVDTLSMARWHPRPPGLMAAEP